MSAAAAKGLSAVVWDIGNVLIEWDPRNLYRDWFDPYEELMERFLGEICTPAWNLEQDRGRSWDEAVATLTAAHPDCAELIRAYRERWDDMVPGTVPGTPELLEELREGGVPLYAITNFSVEMFERASRRFDVLNRFDGIVVSGAERLVKPDPAIFHLFLDRFGLDPATLFYTDDNRENVEAAGAVGMVAHHFTGVAGLREALAEAGLLPAAKRVSARSA